MNAPITSSDITAASVVEIEPDLAGDWPALLVLAHIRMAGLIRENHDLKDEIEQLTAEYCDVCGCRPCRNPSFCDACRRADQNRKRGRR
jgi:hypothetical protein